MPTSLQSPLLAEVILQAQRMRARVLATVFAITGIAPLIGEVLRYFFREERWIPPVAAEFALALALVEVLIGWSVERRMRGGRQIPDLFWIGTSMAEISLVTGVIAAVGMRFEQPLFALSIPAVLAYFIFIIFSTLRLDPWISRFTGAMAAAQYLVLVWVLLALTPGREALSPMVGSALPYVLKAGLLMAGGIGTAFVAGELRRRIEAAIADQSERDRMRMSDRAKSNFIAHMSHDIRAPLNAILGYTQILANDRGLTETQRNAVATIGASGDHLLTVVNQILDLSRVEAGREELKIQPFRLDYLLRDLAAPFELRCREKSLAWTLRYDPVTWIESETGAPEEAKAPVLGDADRLRQVLHRLLDNAVRLTASGGVRLEVERDGERTLLHVVDTGPGIAPERQPSIFEPFLEASIGVTRGGAGLGLAIAQAQTRLMGGSLRLESVPGVGSRFTVELALPMARPVGGGAPSLARPAS